MEILMSVRGNWANLIYQEKKTIELRKTAPRNFSKMGVFVYVYNTDCKSIDGRFFVSEVVEVGEITEELSAKSCVSVGDIANYKGTGKLFAWVISGADYLGPDLLRLEDLGAKCAPQSWQYIYKWRRYNEENTNERG